MNPQDNNRDEEKLAFLLAATNKDAAPPDRAFLDRLREQSAAAFQAEFSRQAPPQKRRRVMITRTLGVLAASVAAAILIGASLFRWYSLSGAGLTLREALENSAEAQTLHLLLLRGVAGEARSEGWIKQPNQLRLDEPDGTYQVANGPKLWLVNEQANQ